MDLITLAIGYFVLRALGSGGKSSEPAKAPERGVLQWAITGPLAKDSSGDLTTYFENSMSQIVGLPKLGSEVAELSRSAQGAVYEATATFSGSTKGPIRPEVFERWSAQIGKDFKGLKLQNARRVA